MTKLQHGNTALKTLVGLAACGFGMVVKAQATPEIDPVELLDRLTVALTGVPATAAQVADYEAGKSLSAIAEELRSSAGFETRLTNYWLHVLQISGPLNLLTNIDASKPGPNNTLEFELGIHQDASVPFGFRRVTYDPLNGGVSRDPAANPANGDYPKTLFLTQGDGTRTKGVYYVPYYSRPGAAYPGNKCMTYNLSYVLPVDPSCFLKVTPYWDPKQQILVDPAVITWCGQDLTGCFPDFDGDAVYLDPNDHYLENVTSGFTLEPGRIAARTVIDGRSWSDVVTGSEGIATGAMLHYIKYFGKPTLDAIMPPGTYSDRGTSSVYDTPDPTDLSSHWVEKGPLGAGILTTMAFQRVTNGYRAKFHRAFTAFLCRDFVAPDSNGQQPPPGNETETDLTKKQPCNHCHVVIEPATTFFERWPAEGDQSYFYSAGVDAASVTGTFNGMSAADTLGFGKIVAGMPDFYDCGVKRAFEFVMGRQMNAKEAETMLGPLSAELQQTQKLWPIFKEIIDSDAFKNGMVN